MHKKKEGGNIFLSAICFCAVVEIIGLIMVIHCFILQNLVGASFCAFCCLLVGLGFLLIAWRIEKKE